MEQEITDDHVLEMISIIKKNSALLLFMISDLLDLGRINKGDLKINISRFNID